MMNYMAFGLDGGPFPDWVLPAAAIFWYGGAAIGLILILYTVNRQRIDNFRQAIRELNEELPAELKLVIKAVFVIVCVAIGLSFFIT